MENANVNPQNPQNQTTVFSLGISASLAKKLEYALLAERESIQEAIEAQARTAKMDKLQVYAMRLTANAIAERYARYDEKRTKVLESAIKILVASGMPIDKARLTLGLDAK